MEVCVKFTVMTTVKYPMGAIACATLYHSPNFHIGISGT